LANQIVGKNFVEGLSDGCELLATAELFRGEDTELLCVDHGLAAQDFEKVIEVRFIQEDGSTGGDIIDPGFLQQHDVEANAPPRGYRTTMFRIATSRSIRSGVTASSRALK
jgi:hypothetical protein